jgi:membrane-bound lytic murein transglycosylase B
MGNRFGARGARALFAAAALATVTALGAAPAQGMNGYLSRADVTSFIGSLHSEHGFDLAELERVLGQAVHQPAVVRLIGPERQPTAKAPIRSYPKYRKKFLTPARINAGVQYWAAHEEYLKRAEAEFGVPAEVILGIIGVETAYGRNTGSYRVVDALATIAFDGQRRQDYFREELKELLLLARDIGIDPLAFKGSYAGAVGLPQFMPSSYRKHAVDFDADGAIDLIGSPADAVGSVASYLEAHGWKKGEPATVPVRLPAGTAPELVSGLKRVHTVADLKKSGVKFTGAGTGTQLPEDSCSVVELPHPGKGSKYFAGFGNFEVITRYNRSTFYATAVLELAEAIRKARSTLTAENQDAVAAPAS